MNNGFDNVGNNHLREMMFLMNNSSRRSECLKVMPLPRPVIANLWQMSWDEIAFLTISNSVRADIDHLLVNEIIRNCPKVKMPATTAIFLGNEIIIDLEFLRNVGVYDFCYEFSVRLISSLLASDATEYKMLFKASDLANITNPNKVLSLFAGQTTVLFSSIPGTTTNGKRKISASRSSAIRVNGSSEQLDGLINQLSLDLNFRLKNKVIVGGRHNLIWALPQIACMFYLIKWILQSSEQIDSLEVCVPDGMSYLNFSAETAVRMGLPARIIHPGETIDKQPGAANVIIKIVSHSGKNDITPIGSRHISPTYAALIKSIQSI